MTNYDLETEAIKRAVEKLPVRFPKGDPKNIERLRIFLERYDKAVYKILEEEHD